MEGKEDGAEVKDACDKEGEDEDDADDDWDDADDANDRGEGVFHCCSCPAAAPCPLAGGEGRDCTGGLLLG